MKKILTLNAISSSIYDSLPQDKYSISNNCDAPDGILVRSANCHDITINDNLLAIARAGAGVNNIPVERCTQAGIVVFNTPGANANAVKELAICLMLMVSRNVMPGITWVSNLEGDDIANEIEHGKREFLGCEISGKTLAVIGLGAIGVMVANDAHSLGMRVIGYDPFISVEHAWGLSRSIERGNSLEQILPVSDYVSLHIPLMDATRHYFNEHLFSKMKPGSTLLNLARGELVDQAPLKAALESGVLKHYITDFPDANVLKMKNVIPVPHLGATTPESEENCARMAAKELHEYLSLGNISNSVNMPGCGMMPSGNVRVCAMHHNVKNMVGQITGIIADDNANITNMMNRSKGDVAYTLLDLDDDLSDNAVRKINNVEGMIRVRIISH